MAKTITGSVYTLTTARAIHSVIRFVYASAPGLHSGGLLASAEPVTANIGADGTFSVVLATGSYKITIDGDQTATWYCTVEAGASETLDVYSILVPTPGAAPTPSSVVPVATDSVAGKVQLADGGTLGRVYTQAQVDALVLAAAAVTVNTIAAANAMTKAAMAAAKVVLVLGGTAAFDGGGGIYIYQLLTDADDGMQYLRPVDYVTSGLLRKLI